MHRNEGPEIVGLERRREKGKRAKRRRQGKSHLRRRRAEQAKGER